MVTWQEFQNVDMRVGTILSVEDFSKAKFPAYQVLVDFGKEIGTKKSSAQITQMYTKEELIGKQVICVVNFPPKQIYSSAISFYNLLRTRNINSSS